MRRVFPTDYTQTERDIYATKPLGPPLVSPLTLNSDCLGTSWAPSALLPGEEVPSSLVGLLATTIGTGNIHESLSVKQKNAGEGRGKPDTH